MRLIAADKLIKNFLCHCRSEYVIKHCCMIAANVINLIRNAPTVESPKGKWIWVESLWMKHFRFKCESCGRIVDNRENYCPKCGLKNGVAYGRL